MLQLLRQLSHFEMVLLFNPALLEIGIRIYEWME
uniref:Uncharacterized protein n=1 Tax=Picea glauca TaxID=3330 RepID=A0A101LUT6_PICGL|nr:hypothetical protein ABT39_MTgene2543 [Picea glauca]QHR89090.1 hypothetical protein Q903MT_gene3109 [Picea sitchensis]